AVAIEDDRLGSGLPPREVDGRRHDARDPDRRDGEPAERAPRAGRRGGNERDGRRREEPAAVFAARTRAIVRPGADAPASARTSGKAAPRQTEGTSTTRSASVASSTR